MNLNKELAEDEKKKEASIQFWKKRMAELFNSNGTLNEEVFNQNGTLKSSHRPPEYWLNTKKGLDEVNGYVKSTGKSFQELIGIDKTHSELVRIIQRYY